MSGDSRPRILFLNHWAGRLGGAEHSLLDVLEFAVRRCECHLACTEEGTLLERARRLGVTCHVIECRAAIGNIRRWNLPLTVLRNWRGMLSFIAYLIRLRRFVKGLRPDLVHANVPKSHIALFVLARTGAAAKCCFHVREIFDRGSVSMLLYRFLFPRAPSRVIAISHRVRECLPSRMRPCTAVIHNGIPVAAQRRERDAGTLLRGVYLGRVVPWKGCHHLVEATRQVAFRYGQDRFRLSIVGGTLYWSSQYRVDLERQIDAAGLSACCRLLPHTDDPHAVYAEHDLFCNASHEEPFGRTVAEAQGNGLPVAAFGSGGVPEIVDDGRTGLLVPEGDVKALANAIGRFIDEPQLVAAMGERGRQRAAEQFNRLVQGPRIVDALVHQATGGT